MASNAAPQYGRQYIRYAETWNAATDTESGTIGTVEVGEFRVVAAATYAGAFYAAPPSAFTAPASVTSIVGVNQAYMPTAIASPATARQLTVATSGLLLVEVAPASAAIALNTPLQIDTEGRATAAGVAVTKSATTPIVREYLTIGGRRMVMVSFD